jgi:MFS transporter, UMF1 family
MSFDEVERPRHSARYEGEDSSATTPRELNGWYAGAIAAEVFAVVGVGEHQSHQPTVSWMSR